MMALLGTNVLIALFDPSHTYHSIAAWWFRGHADEGWAMCPITENGFVRIVSHSSYPQPIMVSDALEILRRATNHPSHSFWPDDVCIGDQVSFNDTHLLGLAVRHGGYLVTLDRRIDVVTVRAASDTSLMVLDHLVVKKGARHRSLIGAQEGDWVVPASDAALQWCLVMALMANFTTLSHPHLLKPPHTALSDTYINANHTSSARIPRFSCPNRMVAVDSNLKDAGNHTVSARGGLQA